MSKRQPPKTAPPPGDQVFKHLSLHFPIVLGFFCSPVVLASLGENDCSVTSCFQTQEKLIFQLLLRWSDGLLPSFSYGRPETRSHFFSFSFPQIMKTIQTPLDWHMGKRNTAYLCTVMTVNNKTEQSTQTCYTSINLKPAEHKKPDPEEHPGCDSICMKCSGEKKKNLWRQKAN